MHARRHALNSRTKHTRGPNLLSTQHLTPEALVEAALDGYPSSKFVYHLMPWVIRSQRLEPTGCSPIKLVITAER